MAYGGGVVRQALPIWHLGSFDIPLVPVGTAMGRAVRVGARFFLELHKSVVLHNDTCTYCKALGRH